MAKVKKPSVKLQALNVFAGKWITQGTVHAVGGKPSSEMRAVDAYEWLPGQFFMLHRVDANMDGMVAKSIEIMGYDAERGCYVTRSYDDQGMSVQFTARLDGHSWEIDGDTMRFRGAFSGDRGTLSGTWEQRSDDGKWTPWIDIEVRKVT